MSWLATNERDPMRHACMGNGDRIGSLCAFWNPARGEREMRAGGNWIRGRRTSRCQREGKGREEEIDAAGRAISRGELGRRSDGRVLWLKRSADLLLVSRPRPTFIPFSSGKRTTITIPSSPKHYSTRIMVQCQGKTKAGQQCLNSGPHDGYCHHHVSQQLQQPQQQPQQPSSVVSLPNLHLQTCMHMLTTDSATCRYLCHAPRCRARLRLRLLALVLFLHRRPSAWM
ncbi:hypothetical protein IWX46DRAFT_617347 [Phyllosticta citricarpa]|uniref:Uncharacterized protein n=1 Tax=Phyllosticta citricarpa TaxID=55181 RepID=A0ABR1L2A9_9PEZI